MASDVKASDKPGDYLIVEDPQKSTTWHLQVKVDGKPEHNLMGAAHAALMSPSGYRGQKYEGPGKQEAIAKLRKLYEAEGMQWPEGKEQAEKAGARHSAKDVEQFQSVHDLMVEHGAKCSPANGGESRMLEEMATHEAGRLVVFKDAQTGRYRWIIFSSTAFRDLDHQIVSTKALEADIAEADLAGYGPLRWWHVGNPDRRTGTAGKGVDLGMCDFSGMDGRVRIDVGTFYDEEVGKAMAKHADELGASIGFFHPANEPGSDGVYYHIRVFERSLLPKDKAANQFTRVMVTSKEDGMLDGVKAAVLKQIVGEQKFTEIMQAVQATEKQADDEGVAYKAQTQDGTPEPAPAEVKADVPPPAAPAPPATVGEMAPADLVALVQQACMDACNQAMGGGMAGMGKSLGELKAAVDAAGKAQALQDALKAEIAGLKDLLSQASGAQAAQAEKATGTLTQLDERLQALEGNAPQSGLQALRPSRINVMPPGEKLKGGPDPKRDWLDDAVTDGIRGAVGRH